MEKNIRQIGKVTIDATQDKSRDKYSDGDIENDILAIVRRGKIEQALHEDARWPVLYHLSEERQNILSWLPLTKEDDVLEIGAGCGAVTGALCRRAGHVDAVDISPRRSEISAWRNKEHANLTIHVGNLNDLELGRQYDVVTLIGVLEYAGAFTHTDDPYHDFLTQCQKYLKPGGRLVIAIENRLGMKYWAGAGEDHTGVVFDGICNYPTRQDVHTFSRKELAQLLMRAGYPAQQWFYPYPDYKFPMEIHSDRCLPSPDAIRRIANGFPGTYDHERYVFFSEGDAFAGAASAGLYPEFANSFLVVCSSQPMDEEALPIYIHPAAHRKAAYRIGTAVYEQGGRRHVEKFTRTAAARRHLAAIEENGRILAELYGKDMVAPSHRVSEDVLWCDYAEGESFFGFSQRAVRERGPQGFYDCLNFFASCLVRGTEQPGPTGLDFFAPGRRYDVDLTFDNVYVSEGRVQITDYEYLTAERSQAFALLHALEHFHMMHGKDWAELGLTKEFFLQEYHLTQADWDAFIDDWNAYVSTVMDNYMDRYAKMRHNVRL